MRSVKPWLKLFIRVFVLLSHFNVIPHFEPKKDAWAIQKKDAPATRKKDAPATPWPFKSILSSTYKSSKGSARRETKMNQVYCMWTELVRNSQNEIWKTFFCQWHAVMQQNIKICCQLHRKASKILLTFNAVTTTIPTDAEEVTMLQCSSLWRSLFSCIVPCLKKWQNYDGLEGWTVGSTSGKSSFNTGIGRSKKRFWGLFCPGEPCEHVTKMKFHPTHSISPTGCNAWPVEERMCLLSISQNIQICKAPLNDELQWSHWMLRKKARVRKSACWGPTWTQHNLYTVSARMEPLELHHQKRHIFPI